ncbi:MAG: hypothetical protein AMXMBFR33_41310 [Candidatus Xenobia bacterium]
MKVSQPRRKPTKTWCSLRIEPAQDEAISALAADLGVTESEAARRALAAGLALLYTDRSNTQEWAHSIIRTLEKAWKPA